MVVSRYLAVAALAGACTRAPTARPAVPRVPPAAAPTVAVRIRSVARDGVGLRAVAGLPDGGLVVVGSALGTIEAGATTGCAVDEPSLFIARVDRAGVVTAVTCLPAKLTDGVIAASERGIWIAHNVEPRAPEHIHGDVLDLAVVDRFTADGALIDSKVIAVWKDRRPSASRSRGADLSNAGTAASNFVMKSATLHGDDLVITGASLPASIADARWEVHDAALTLQGFVLAVAPDGAVRSIFDGADVLIQDIALAGSRYVATGWCSSTHGRPPLVAGCQNASTTAIVIDGDITGANPPRIQALGSDIFDLVPAIARDGAFAVGGRTWRSFAVGGQQVSATCAPTAFAAAWAADGTLELARALGDCTRDGAGLGDDRIADHALYVTDVAMIDGAPVVTVRVGAPELGDEGAVHFDDTAVDVAYAEDSVVVTLEHRGDIARLQHLGFAGKPESDDQPDASMSPGAGVHRAIPVVAGDQRWLVVHHGGTMMVGGRRFPAASRLRSDEEVGETHFETGQPIHRDCHADRILDDPKAPSDNDVIDYEEGSCRERVSSEQVIELLLQPAS